MLNETEKNEILKEFPNIKLSYESIEHNKVYQTINNTDFTILIPEGKRGFTWFTEFKNQNVCLFIEVGQNKQIYNITIIKTCFTSKLSFGTIFYGTLTNYNEKLFFFIEDIFLYKGRPVYDFLFIDKLKIIHKIFLKNEIRQISYGDNHVVFGLPIIIQNQINQINQIKINNLDFIENNIPNNNYSIKYIQFRNANHFNTCVQQIIYNKNLFLEMDNCSVLEQSTTFKPHLPFIPKPPPPLPLGPKPLTERLEQIQQIPIFKPPLPPGPKPITISTTTIHFSLPKKQNTREIVFKIKPDIQNDIYLLHVFDTITNTYKLVEFASIPDYKTSVFMNQLFRNIKENSNLDKLEESDDEDEFEDSRTDKHVYLEREYDMVCTFNYRFKKWCPIRLALSSQKVILLQDFYSLKKR